MEDKPQAEPADHLANAARGFGRFKSCWWIQEGLYLDCNGLIRPCCQNIPGPDRPRLVTYGRLADENFDLTAERRKLQIANQGPDAPCAGCVLLVERDWPECRHLSYVDVATENFCNYACCYCVGRSKSSKSAMDGGVVMNRLEKWKAGGLLHPESTLISVAGGEPLLNTFFQPGSEFCLRHGFRMQLISNSSVASDRVAELAEAGRLRLMTSLDAGAAETYARIHGLDCLDRVWANIARYVQAAPEPLKGNIRVKYILLEANLSRKEIDAFAERVERNGVRLVFLALENHVSDMAKIGQADISKYVDAGGYFLHRLRRVPGLKVMPNIHTWPQLHEMVEKRAAEFGQSPDLIAGRVPAEAPRDPLPIVHTAYDLKLGVRTVRRELTRRGDFCVYKYGFGKPEEQPKYFFELAGYFVQDSLADYAARYPGQAALYRMAVQARQNGDATGRSVLPRGWLTRNQICPDDYLVKFITDDDGARVFQIDFQYRRRPL